MASKIITIPKDTIDVMTQAPRDGRPGKTEPIRSFLHLIAQVNEIKKQKTDTETFLSHDLAEKIKAVKDTDETIELNEADIDFVLEGIKQIRSDQGISGPVWYNLIAPLRDAQPKKKLPLKP